LSQPQNPSLPDEVLGLGLAVPEVVPVPLPALAPVPEGLALGEPPVCLPCAEVPLGVGVGLLPALAPALGEAEVLGVGLALFEPLADALGEVLAPEAPGAVLCPEGQTVGNGNGFPVASAGVATKAPASTIAIVLGTAIATMRRREPMWGRA
jgi:hypothetical protein